MEQEVQQYLEVARTGVDIVQKTGVLKRIGSLFASRQSEEQPEEQVNYREEALKALQQNALETIGGLELTVGQALLTLEPGFTLDDLDKVNSTWQKHWTAGTSRVGIDDEERRTWWARLLAGEIQQPETFSLRTLAVMETLSTKEARLFSRLCDYIWNPTNPVLVLPTDESELWKPDFVEAAILESIGLVKFDTLTGFLFRLRQDAETLQIEMRFNNDVFFISGMAGTSVELRCGTLLLTDVGTEMYRLTTPNYPQLYRDEIVSEWRQSYNVEGTS